MSPEIARVLSRPLTFPHIRALGVWRCTASLSSIARPRKASVSVSTDLGKFWSRVLGVDLTGEIRGASTGEVPGGSLGEGKRHEEGGDSSNLHRGGNRNVRLEISDGFECEFLRADFGGHV